MVVLRLEVVLDDLALDTDDDLPRIFLSQPLFIRTEGLILRHCHRKEVK